MTEIYVNGQLVHMEEEEVIAATYGNIAFGEFSKRMGVKTNTFSIPINNNNKLILENADIVNNGSIIPYRFFSLVINLNGTEAFNGLGYITEVHEKIQIQSIAGSSTFYATISERKIQELDLSEFNHIYNVENILSSWSNTKGYMYALVGYGIGWETLNNSAIPLRRIPPNYFYPQVFTHTVVRQILKQAGYEIKGRVLEDSRFLREVIIFNTFPFPYQMGDTINIATLLPDMLQSKTILDFMNKYGLMADVDNENGVVTFDFIDDILFKEPIYWENKIDESERPKITFDLGYGQTSELKFKESEIPGPARPVVLSPRTKAVIIDNTTIEKIKQIYESPFFCVGNEYFYNQSGTLIGESVMTSTGSIMPKNALSANIWDPTQNNLRLVFHNGGWYQKMPDVVADDVEPGTDETMWKPVTEQEAFTFKNNPMIGVIESNMMHQYYLYANGVDYPIHKVVKGDQLDWGITYDKYYKVFDRIIKNTKVVELLMKLTYADINQLDFTRPYWFDRFNGLFILEEVTQYKLNQSDSTWCRFIRI